MNLLTKVELKKIIGEIVAEEGIGGGDPTKDPKMVKGCRWKIKYESDEDLEKHGNTEISKVKNEKISINEVKSIISEIIREMWVGLPSPAIRDDMSSNAMELDGSVSDQGGEHINFNDHGSENDDLDQNITDPFLKETTKEIHSISKPVKIENEWVVKWITNGRRNEDRTYYTDDKQDAWDTFNEMEQQAYRCNRLNLK